MHLNEIVNAGGFGLCVFLLFYCLGKVDKFGERANRYFEQFNKPSAKP